MSRQAIAPSETADVHWTNMLLLGFDAAAESKRHMVELGPNAFQLRNAKALEVVFHFLLSKCYPEQASKDFRTCFPVYNDKSRMHEFKTKVFQMLQQLQEDKHLPSNTFRKSTLDDCGERLYQPLCLLSTHVLELTCQREFPSLELPAAVHVEPSQLQYAPLLLRTAKAKVTAESEKFLQGTVRLAQSRAECKAAAARLNERYRCLLDAKRAINREEQVFDTQVDPQIFTDTAALARSSALGASTNILNSLTQLTCHSQANEALFEEMLHNPKPPYTVSQSTVEDQTAAEYSSSSSKVDLVMLVKRWNAHLETISRTLANGAASHPGEQEGCMLAPHPEKFVSELRRQESCLCLLGELRGELIERSSAVESSIRALHAETAMWDRQYATMQPWMQPTTEQAPRSLQCAVGSPWMHPICTSPITPHVRVGTPASEQARFLQGTEQIDGSVQKQVQQQWDAHNVCAELMPEMTPARSAAVNKTPARGRILTPDHSRALKSWQPSAVNRASNQPVKPALKTKNRQGIVRPVPKGTQKSASMTTPKSASMATPKSAFSTRPQVPLNFD